MPMTTAAPRDCAILFTHWWDDRLAKHFERLKQEAGKELPVFLAYHVAGGRALPANVPCDIGVTEERVRSLHPARYSAGSVGGIQWGYVDTLWFTAFADPLLSSYDRIWLIEYDVDYSGDWSKFFRGTRDVPGDIVAAHLRWRRDEPGWHWLTGVTDPLDHADDHMIGFFPISRFSRRAIAAVVEAVDMGWQGHFELLIPTTVRRAGLMVTDLGGDGSLTALERRGRYYDGDFRTLFRAFYAYAFGPPMQHYYAESRLGFWRRDRLYHPVKTHLLGKTSSYAWWMKFRDRLLCSIATRLGRRDLLTTRPSALRRKN
jgi:hypothetical protein